MFSEVVGSSFRSYKYSFSSELKENPKEGKDWSKVLIMPIVSVFRDPTFVFKSDEELHNEAWG